jgi:hypothetical protein
MFLSLLKFMYAFPIQLWSLCQAKKDISASIRKLPVVSFEIRFYLFIKVYLFNFFVLTSVTYDDYSYEILLLLLLLLLLLFYFFTVVIILPVYLFELL